MTSHSQLNDMNGHGGKPRRLLPARLTGPLAPGQLHGEDRGQQLSRLTAQQLRDAPGAPPAGPRFLVAHAYLILAVAIAAVGGAALLVHSQTPIYKSWAVVSIEPAAVAASSGNPPNMATEEGVATSDAVLARAAQMLNVPVATLASGASAKSPGTTTLLEIIYADPDPHIAQQRAQAIAAAYVSYRSPQPGAHGQNPAKSTAPTAVLITPASLPTSPASPNRVLDMGIAVIVGLALGIGAALLRDRLDDHVRGVFDLETQTDSPAAGLIPSFRPGWRHPRGRLVMVTKPDSIVAEAYRGVRTRLLAGRANTKALLVTSPGWEDKSTIAANLAVAIAQSGRSVVLVCADLRWGRAHELFAPVNGYGLSGLLEGRTDLAQALQATEVPGLRLLPPGAVPADPAALLERFSWRMAVGDMHLLADTVIIEAPPVLTGADLQPVASSTEMILMAADAKRTTRAQLRVAAREVRRMRGNLAGCVLDNVGTRRRLRSARLEPVNDVRPEPVNDRDPDTMDFDLPDMGPDQEVGQLGRLGRARRAGHRLRGGDTCLPAYAPGVGHGPHQHRPAFPPVEPGQKVRRRGAPEVRLPQIADPGRCQPQEFGEHAGPVPQQGRVVSGQAGAVPLHLVAETVEVPPVVVAHQCRRLVCEAVSGQHHHGHGEQVRASAGRRSRSQGDVETAYALKRLPPESHARAGAERGYRVERALRALAGEGGLREAVALAESAELFVQHLRRSLQPGRKHQARDAPDVVTAGEPAGEPGQPVAVRLGVIGAERYDFAGRDGQPGIIRP